GRRRARQAAPAGAPRRAGRARPAAATERRARSRARSSGEAPVRELREQPPSHSAFLPRPLRRICCAARRGTLTVRAPARPLDAYMTSVSAAPRAGFGQTQRRDRWWTKPLFVFLGLSAFVVYSTWAAFQGDHY